MYEWIPVDCDTKVNQFLCKITTQPPTIQPTAPPSIESIAKKKEIYTRLYEKITTNEIWI